MVIRLIHACGMVEVADRLAFSARAAEAGQAALAAGAPVLCDCEMVRAGIIAGRLPHGVETVVTLNDPRVPRWPPIWAPRGPPPRWNCGKGKSTGRWWPSATRRRRCSTFWNGSRRVGPGRR